MPTRITPAKPNVEREIWGCGQTWLHHVLSIVRRGDRPGPRVRCAPTSAGKTLIAELVVARHAGSGVTVYLVSHRALAAQIQRGFERHHTVDGRPLLKSGLLTGDQDTVGRNWSGMDVVISTYEKFYGALIGDGGRLRNIWAVVADKIQLAGESHRGPTVEFLLAEVRKTAGGKRPQFIGLSATAPNGKELADWLDASPVVVTGRQPPLEHEIWSPGQRVVFRDRETAPERLTLTVDTADVGLVMKQLLDNRLGFRSVSPSAFQWSPRGDRR